MRRRFLVLALANAVPGGGKEARRQALEEFKKRYSQY